MRDEIHIASLIVHVRPDCRAAARALLAASPGIEIHGEDNEGRLVIVVETATEAGILTHMAAINEIPGIIATSLVYHEIDSDPDDLSTPGPEQEEATHA